MPADYEERLVEMSPGEFRNLRLCAPDPYDLILSKLERNSSKDRDDVEYLAQTLRLNPGVLHSTTVCTFGPPIEKRLFWREFRILFGAGLIADAILVAISRLPTTPVAMFLFVKGNAQRPVLLGIAAAETVIELALIVGLGLLAARSHGLGAPILEKRLRGEPIRPHLQSVFVPALLVGVLVGLWAIVPNFSTLHQSRQTIHREAEKILDSPAEAKFTELVNRTSGRGMQSGDLALSYVCDAILGGLTARLFFLSGIVWILAKVARTTSVRVSPALLWIAIFLLIAGEAIRYLAWQSIFGRLMSDALGGIWLPKPPFWLTVERVLLKIVPAGVGLGWLYLRRGLEGAMLGSVIASVVGYAATMFLFARLY